MEKYKLLNVVLFMLALVILLLAATLFSFVQWGRIKITGAVIYEDISVCRELNQSNTVYRLINDVSSEGTCFTITNHSITIDCQGHTINFSTSGASNSRGIYSNGYNSITIRNCTIIEGISSTQNYGIQIQSAENIIIESTIVDVIGNTGGVVSISGNNITINNSHLSGNSTYVPSLSLDSPSICKIMNTEFFSHGDNGRGLLVFGGGNCIISNNTITVLGQSGTAIATNGINDTIFSDIVINLNGTSSTGISLGGASKNLSFENLMIYKNAEDEKAVYYSSYGNINATITNSYLDLGTANSGTDVYFDQNTQGMLNLTNVSFSAGYFNSTSTTQLVRKWWLDVYVTDSETSLPLAYTNVSIWYNNSLVDSALTDSQGHARFALIRYINTTSAITYYNNYVVNVSKTGYENASNMTNMTSNVVMNFALSEPSPVQKSSINITITYPSDGQNIYKLNFPLQFSVVSTYAISNCTLYLTSESGTQTQTITNIQTGSNSFSLSLSSSSHNKILTAVVSCTDTNGNTTNSSSINFRVMNPAALSEPASGGTGKHTRKN